MPIVAQIDELGRPAWIALMVLSFFVFWPLGLAVLAFLIGSGRMSCNSHGRWERKMGRLQEKMDFFRTKMQGNGGDWWGPSRPSSGNRAFDDYRADTLKRLEEEQREFREFLDRLRFARDKTEFDQFMSERHNGPGSGSPQPQA